MNTNIKYWIAIGTLLVISITGWVYYTFGPLMATYAFILLISGIAKALVIWFIIVIGLIILNHILDEKENK